MTWPSVTESPSSTRSLPITTLGLDGPAIRRTPSFGSIRARAVMATGALGTAATADPVLTAPAPSCNSARLIHTPIPAAATAARTAPYFSDQAPRAVALIRFPLFADFAPTIPNLPERWQDALGTFH